MTTPIPPANEHCIVFQAFLTSSGLSGFLLENRLERVRGRLPELGRVRVVVQGNTTVKPHHLTTLACLLEEYRQAGIAISFEDAGSPVYTYLDGIGFFTRWQPDYSFDLESLLLPTDTTSFVVWQIRRETMDAYISCAYQHYASGFFRSKDLSVLPTYLAELFNNVLDHAFAGEATERIAFAFLQYYPSRKRLFTSVSDFGLGISASINRYLRSNAEEPVTASEAVKKALKLGFTTRSQPYNKGWGLHTVSSGIEHLRGQLVIQTSWVIYTVLQSGKKILHRLPDTQFPGTTVSLTMFYHELPDEEASVQQEEAFLF